jgi:cell wall-associated NlpC family hydrolase
MDKKILTIVVHSIAVLFLGACSDAGEPATASQEAVRPITEDSVNLDPPPLLRPGEIIETGTTKPADLLKFSKTLIGVPYRAASTDPSKGFDCSGFITYVFNHFNVAVPRSSVDFTYVGKEIDYRMAGPGDLILFTGTDSTIRVVGHMGIVVSNEPDSLLFIHSTSGKAKGVVITKLENYYTSRFVKVIRVFPDRFFS